MQHQQYDLDGDHQAQIWRGAQHRRTEDIRCWFKERQRKSHDTLSHYAAVLFRSLTSRSEPLLPSENRAAGSNNGAVNRSA
jgi:hypothetical protein